MGLLKFVFHRVHALGLPLDTEPSRLVIHDPLLEVVLLDIRDLIILEGVHLELCLAVVPEEEDLPDPLVLDVFSAVGGIATHSAEDKSVAKLGSDNEAGLDISLQVLDGLDNSDVCRKGDGIEVVRLEDAQGAVVQDNTDGDPRLVAWGFDVLAVPVKVALFDHSGLVSLLPRRDLDNLEDRLLLNGLQTMITICGEFTLLGVTGTGHKLLAFAFKTSVLCWDTLPLERLGSSSTTKGALSPVLEDDPHAISLGGSVSGKGVLSEVSWHEFRVNGAEIKSLLRAEADGVRVLVLEKFGHGLAIGHFQVCDHLHPFLLDLKGIRAHNPLLLFAATEWPGKLEAEAFPEIPVVLDASLVAL